ncbi:MAG: Xaa-Pro aminopeptidase [Acidobacteria bacterium]|nr:Xaa-Pro aminopeptidase [Acidobacteriota bacterium]
MLTFRIPLLLLAALTLRAQSALHFQTDFPPEEFAARWSKIYDRIGPQAIALVQGHGLEGGFAYPRQSNEFYYLTGVETPHSFLLLDGRTRKATLFLPPRNRRLEQSEGRVLSADDPELAQNLTGADAIQSTSAMQGDWLSNPTTIYTLLSPAEGTAQQRIELLSANAAISFDPWDGRLSREQHFASLLRLRQPRAKVEDLTAILDELRSVKSPREIALIKRASQLAGYGILEAMKATRPGLFEYHLDAAARYVFLAGGARLEGYRSITASGTPNIWNGHYFRNSSQLKSGDLILMDFAPDYRYYTSDVTRMWPVSGKFSPVQKELLGFVLEYRDAIIARIRPGVTVEQIREEAAVAMESVFARWKFSQPKYEKAARTMVETGGGVFSHPVGLAVHDDGPYHRGPLRPGQVFSIDPQLRVNDETLYIRSEDVVVVTAKGCENFTDFLPSKLEEIERVIGGSGILQQFPPRL